jgi:multifunctional methyltransferase subunit TRM112
MNIHLVQGMLTCPVTGREFPVTDGIPNMMLEEEECENAKF